MRQQLIITPPVIDKSLKIIAIEDDKDLVIVEATTKTCYGTLEGETDTIRIPFGGARSMYRIPQSKLLTREQKDRLRWMKKHVGETAWRQECRRIRNCEISRYTNFDTS
jgi:hypothetical protein